MAQKKLTFVMSLIDKISKPARGAANAVNELVEKSVQAFTKMGVGGAAVWAAGQAMDSLTSDARVMNKALAEVSSLDVSDSSLKKLNAQALKYSILYGESADAFVSSAYDIQSAIAGLTGDELAGFTNASNVLAKATKSNAGTITNYMGTMYGIFKNQATEMGNAKWVEMIAGKTATAVQMFKTTGDNMSGAFTALGASATSAGIDVAEQMAVLGTLQATMSGSEAGTKYKAFLAGVGGAQDKLGLKFTDDNGNMLGVLDILDKIKGKFGDTLDVAEGDALKKAFGSDEAVAMVKLLMADTKGLGESLEKLGQVNGMDKATQMAKKMVDPFDRFSSGFKAMKIGFGQALLPVLNPIVEFLTEGAAAITGWTQEFPTLTSWVGRGAVAIIGLISVVGVLTALVGVFNIVMAANPVIFIITAFVGLIVVLVAVYNNWDKVKGTLSNKAWGRPILAILDIIFSYFEKLFAFWSYIGTRLAHLGKMFYELLHDPIVNAFEAIYPYFEKLFEYIGKLTNPIGEAGSWVTDKIGGIGDWIDEKIGYKVEAPEALTPQKSVPADGSVTKHVANTVNNQRTTTNSKAIGTQNNYYGQQPMHPGEDMHMRTG